MNLTKFLQSQYLQDAYKWVCDGRESHYCSDSAWFFRRDYESLSVSLIESLHDSTYRFEPVKKMVFAQDKPPVWIWNAQDAHGGIGSALAIVVSTPADEYQFVFKSDVKSYYESMDHNVIMGILKKYIQCEKLLDIFEKFLGHLEDDNANLILMKIEISKGCPLSPLLGVLYLSELDEAMGKLPVVYRRFMDDWIVLAKSRWTLRKAIKICNQILSRLKVNKHPDKTYIGRVRCGFDFLGFHINAQGITDLSKSTKEKMLLKLHKLYEQSCKDLIDKYIIGVQTWIRGALSKIEKPKGFSLMPVLLTQNLRIQVYEQRKLQSEKVDLWLHHWTNLSFSDGDVANRVPRTRCHTPKRTNCSDQM